ncbi:hypothetical protein [Haloferax volcanii]|uniref:hypothetical protein n=1 Tax=Haloferax volcanii TaxID=2246 RepID=UPI00349F6347
MIFYKIGSRGEGSLVLLGNNESADQRTKAQKMLRGEYTPMDAVRDSWFDGNAVCNGGSTCNVPPAELIPQKDELDQVEMISSQVQYMEDMWSQNLSANVNDMGSSSASNYLKNGN